MKKFILLFLLIPSLCFAVEPIDFSKSIAMSPAILGGSAGVAGCTLADIFSNTGNNAISYLGETSQKGWIAISTFTPTGTKNITKITIALMKSGTPEAGQTIKGVIYSQSEGVPNVEVAESTTTRYATDLTTSYANYEFDFSGYSATGQHYFGVKVSSLNSGSNWVQVGVNSGGVSGEVSYEKRDATFVSIGGLNSALTIKITSCD